MKITSEFHERSFFSQGYMPQFVSQMENLSNHQKEQLVRDFRVHTVSRPLPRLDVRIPSGLVPADTVMKWLGRTPGIKFLNASRS